MNLELLGNVAIPFYILPLDVIAKLNVSAKIGIKAEKVGFRAKIVNNKYPSVLDLTGPYIEGALSYDLPKPLKDRIGTEWLKQVSVTKSLPIFMGSGIGKKTGESIGLQVNYLDVGIKYGLSLPITEFK